MKNKKLIISSILFFSFATINLQNLQAESLFEVEDNLLTPTTEIIDNEVLLPANLEDSVPLEEQEGYLEEIGIQDTTQEDAVAISNLREEGQLNYQIIDERGVLGIQTARLRDDIIIEIERQNTLDPTMFQAWDKYFNPNSHYFRDKNRSIKTANTFYNIAQGNVDTTNTMLTIFNRLRNLNRDILNIEANFIVFKNYLLTCQGQAVCTPVYNDRDCKIVSQGKTYYFSCLKGKYAFNFGKDISIFNISSNYVQDAMMKQYVKVFLKKVENFTDQILLTNWSDLLTLNDPNDRLYTSNQFKNPDIIHAMAKRRQALQDIADYYNNTILPYAKNNP